MDLKVLIVDDEKLERILIRKGYDWENNGFQIVGEAESGEEALIMIEKEKPDLVLTDISMMNMDGLELSEKIAALSPNTYIVIITGYREFEYARRAVKIGVEDFLLKPVSIADLSLVVKKIKDKIIREKKEKQEVIQLKETVLADHDVVMESFFQKLVEGDVLEEEAKRKLSLSGLDKVISSYYAFNIKLKEENEIRSMKKLKKVIKLVSDEAPFGTICFPHYTYNVIAFVEVEEGFDARSFAEKIHGKIRQDTGMLSTIGISNRHEGIKNMPPAFTESEQALSASVLLGRNRCIAHDEYQSILNKNQSNKEIDWDDFIFSIENGLEDKVHEHISQYVGLIRGSKVTDIEYYRLMTMDMLSKSATTLNKYGSGFNQITGEDHLYSEIRSINVVDEIEPYLFQSIRKVMDFHMKKKSRRGRKVVEDALLFVNQEIYSPDLSLKTVAAKIYSNESYLSRVFKKEMNISLIEYILKKRIEESISLLNSTDLKVYEIAEKIGFRDPHYFSICFKKITGVTVKEFKKLNTSK